MDYSPPGSSVHGILQARTLEWVAIPFSKGSSLLREQTHVSCTAGRFFIIWATREAQIHTYLHLILQVFLGPTSFTRYYLASLLAFIAKFLKRAVDIYCFNCYLFFLSGILSNQVSSLWFFPKNPSCPGYLTYLPHIWLAVQEVAISFINFIAQKTNKQTNKKTIYLRISGLFSSLGVRNHN